MFQVHDRTRRQLAMLAFVVLCLVPTAIVLACGVAWHLPGQVRKESDRLGVLLGLKVSLDDVEYPQPGVVRYVGLTLADGETGKAVLRCQRLETSWHKLVDKQGQERSCLMLNPQEPQLEADGLPHVWRLIREMLTCRADRAQIDARVFSSQLALNLSGKQLKLVDMRGSLGLFAEGTQVDIGFRQEAEKTEGTKIRIARDRKTAPPTTRFALQTGGTPLPCSLLAAVFPSLELLGPQSGYLGYLWAAETPQGWDGGLAKGQFLAVDLERLLNGRSPHRIRGTVQVAIEEAQFQQGRLQLLTGSMVGGQGEVSRSLVETSVEHLALLRGQEVPGTEPLLPYEQLGLWFSLDARGLALHGQCPSAGSGAILVDRYGPLLLSQATSQPQPVASLVRALVPSSIAQVPATREADGLLRCLPLPGSE
jgi:hypothetical protein